MTMDDNETLKGQWESNDLRARLSLLRYHVDGIGNQSILNFLKYVGHAGHALLL